MKKEKYKVDVVMDENGDQCAIVGVKSIKQAEKYLRKIEKEEWGTDNTPIPMDLFWPKKIRVGQVKGETYFDWGGEIQFDKNSFVERSGFIANLP